MKCVYGGGVSPVVEVPLLHVYAIRGPSLPCTGDAGLCPWIVSDCDAICSI